MFLWAANSLLTLTNNKQQPPAKEGKTMLWKDFIRSLHVEDICDGFTANLKLGLEIMATPDGNDSGPFYPLRAKLFIRIVGVKKASYEEITVVCGLVSPFPPGFKSGGAQYTLSFTFVSGSYICGDRHEDLEQMLRDGEISESQIRALLGEAPDC